MQSRLLHYTVFLSLGKQTLYILNPLYVLELEHFINHLSSNLVLAMLVKKHTKEIKTKNIFCPYEWIVL